MANPFLYLLMKGELPGSSLDLPDGKKVVEQYANNAKDPEADYPVLKDEIYIAIKKDYQYEAYYRTFNSIQVQANKPTADKTIDEFLNRKLEYYGAKQTNRTDTKNDLEKAKKEGVDKANKFYEDLKSAFPAKFTGDLNEDFENLRKIDIPIQKSYYNNDLEKGMQKWKIEVKNLFELDDATSVATLCEGETYTYQVASSTGGTTKEIKTRFRGVIPLTATEPDPNNPNILIISSQGKEIKLEKVIDKLTNDYSKCYKIIKGVEFIDQFFSDTVEPIEILQDPNDVASTPENAGRPSEDEAKEEAKRRKDAVNQLFGSFDNFDQQCILLKLIDKVTGQIEKDENGLKKPYKNIISLETDSVLEARAITNIINGSDRFLPFMNIPNHIASTLMPKIRLVKSYVRGNENNKTGKPQIDVEIPMEEFVDQRDILEGNISRGFGFGLKSFSWENSSFNEVDRNIDATLTLKFSNMDSFIRERKGRVIGLSRQGIPNIEKFETFKFIELIYQSPSVNPENSDKAQQNSFHIKITVGWSYDDNILADLVPDPKERLLLKESIDNNTSTFYLFNKGHDINFEKDGSVNITINYQSAQEARMNDERYSNVFNMLDSEKQKKIKELEDKAKETEKQLEQDATTQSKTTTQQTLEQLLKDRATLETELTNELHALFIETLYTTSSVKLLAISSKELIALKSSLYPLPDSKRPNIKRLKDLEKEIYENSSNTEKVKSILSNRLSEKGEKIVPFIYFGDLLSIVIGIINKDSSVEPLKMATGPYVYQKFTSETLSQELKLTKLQLEDEVLKTVNIADIPISFDYFIYWFEEEIVKKNKRKYTVRSFLSDLLNKFFLQVLRPNCFGKNFTIGNFKLDINILNVPVHQSKDILAATAPNVLGSTRMSVKEAKNIMNSFAKSRKSERLEVVPYLYMQILYTKQNFIIVNEDNNSMQGMYHLRLGAEKGLVKEINFSKDDNRYIGPAIYSQQGAVNPKILRVPYNADISMIGNTIFKPGSLVYIDPTFALSIPTLKNETTKVIDEMNLGGFYLVTRTRNVIESGKFATNLNCRFVARGVRKTK